MDANLPGMEDQHAECLGPHQRILDTRALSDEEVEQRVSRSIMSMGTRIVTTETNVSSR